MCVHALAAHLRHVEKSDTAASRGSAFGRDPIERLCPCSVVTAEGRPPARQLPCLLFRRLIDVGWHRWNDRRDGSSAFIVPDRHRSIDEVDPVRSRESRRYFVDLHRQAGSRGWAYHMDIEALGLGLVDYWLHLEAIGAPMRASVQHDD